MQDGKRRERMVASLRSRRGRALQALAWTAWQDRVEGAKEGLAEAERRAKLSKLEVARSAFAK